MPPALNRAHIRPGDRICAAVSGGADSVAMLMLLHEANALKKNAVGVGLSAVHVHHGLRGEEADGDLKFVEELCLRLGVPLHAERASVPERMAKSRALGDSETMEEAARGLRYEMFARLMAEGHADSVLTAHTLDDQAETVLMKLLRGAWTEGLSGIAPVVQVQGTRDRGQGTGKIVRPLLGVRRAELEEYLRGRGQSWRTDSSNADERFTRNRVRHKLLPTLREYNPAIDTALANMATLAREDEARWQAELGLILPQMLLPGRPVRGGGRAVRTRGGEDGSVAIELERLRALNAAARRRVVRAAARSLGVRLGFDDTARMLALAGADPEGGAEGEAIVGAAKARAAALDLPGGLRAQRTARELQLTRANCAK